MDYDDLVRAFIEDEEEERFKKMTQKSKSRTRHKTGKRPKLDAEAKKIAIKRDLIRKTRDFERNDLRHIKRTVALRLGDKSSTKLRKVFAQFRQGLSEI